jgi:hypothetical protein
MTWILAIRSDTKIMVLHKNLSPPHDVNPIGTDLDTLTAGDTRTASVQAILPDRITEPGGGPYLLGNMELIIVIQVHNPP